ncbi:MAG: hypothetical protein AAB013_01150, partial [Planctomycetota bacterium]
RGGSRKTGTFVDDNIKGVCAYARYDPTQQCGCPVFDWCFGYDGQYASGEAYLNSTCSAGRYNRNYELCACNSPYNLVKVVVYPLSGGGRYEVFECRKN